MTSTPPALLLARCDAKRVDAWIRHGIVPAYVAPLAGWSAIVPAGGALAAPPYDDGAVVLANTPLPVNLRVGLGFFVLDGHAVVVVHPRGWRALARWLVWSPRSGTSRLPGFPPARAIDLTRGAGVVDDVVPAVRTVLGRTTGTPQEFLEAMMDALGLPGAELMHDGAIKHLDDAILVEPGRRSVERFERVTSDDKDIRAELSEHQ